jgi:hypothetical protein
MICVDIYMFGSYDLRCYLQKYFAICRPQPCAAANRAQYSISRLILVAMLRGWESGFDPRGVRTTSVG